MNNNDIVLSSIYVSMATVTGFLCFAKSLVKLNVSPKIVLIPTTFPIITALICGEKKTAALLTIYVGSCIYVFEKRIRQ